MAHAANLLAALLEWKKQIEPLLATIAQVSPIDVESAMKGAASLFGAEVWADLKRKGQ